MDIKKLRKEKGMTQIEAAIKSGVSLTTFQLWERGVTTPNEENMKKLILALKGE